MRRRESAACGTPVMVTAASNRRIPGHWYSVEVAARSAHGAPDGAHVIVEITKRPQGEAPAHGRIVEVLENLRPSDLAARFAILRHDLPQEFPPEVLHAANLFDPEVAAADCAGREDLRDLPLVTIDGEDAKDFDDAVYAESLRGGGWRLVVAIADVSHYVRPGSALDSEARARATSVYFPDRVLPMLPEHLSNHLCSLMPRVERLAFVCDMRVSKAGAPGRARFYEAVIRSHARLTYDQAWAVSRRIRAAPADDELTPAVRASLAEPLCGVRRAENRARSARRARFSRRRGQGAHRRERQDRGVLRGDAQRCASPDRGVHDRRQRRGGGGAASGQGGKPVPGTRPARREARHRTAEGHECAAGGRDVLREAEARANFGNWSSGWPRGPTGCCSRGW